MFGKKTIDEKGHEVNRLHARFVSQRYHGDITRAGARGIRQKPPTPARVISVQGVGNYVRVVVSAQGGKSRGIRGEVRGFSASSRRRLFDLLAAVDWQAAGCVAFITLTYGQAWPGAIESKEHLHRYWHWLRRHGAKSVIWRCERQERGALHYHLLAIGMPFVDKLKVQTGWARIVGRKYWDNRPGCQRMPFVRIEGIRSAHGVRFYVAKYIVKDAPTNPERHRGRVRSGDEAVGGAAASGGGSPDSSKLPEAAAPTASPVGLTKGTYLDEIGRAWGVYGRSSLPLGAAGHAVMPEGKRSMHCLRMVAQEHFPKLSDSGLFGFRVWLKDGETFEGFMEKVRVKEKLWTTASGSGNDRGSFPSG